MLLVNIFPRHSHRNTGDYSSKVCANKQVYFNELSFQLGIKLLISYELSHNWNESSWTHDWNFNLFIAKVCSKGTTMYK